jgi:peptide/nickel transport system permease protein
VIKKIKSYHIALWVIFLYVLIALTAPFLANDKSILCVSETTCLQPIIPFSPTTTHIEAWTSLRPMSSTIIDGSKHIHWLGTDKLGRDVASGLIHGTRISLMVGFMSVVFIFILGVSMGMVSAYSRHKNFSLNLFQIISIFIVSIIGIFYMIFEFQFSSHKWVSTLAIAGLMCVIISLVYLLGNRMKSFDRYVVSLDLILMKVIEARKSFPGMFLFLALTGIFTLPSVWNVIFVISLLGWTEFARHTRAETMSVLETDYITSAKILGLSDIRILFRHVLPNILPTLWVLTCFSVASSILIESTLSFIGIGLPAQTVTWGKMMAEGRNMQSWWMVVFPGLAIFSIVYSLNIIADHLQRKT